MDENWQWRMQWRNGSMNDAHCGYDWKDKKGSFFYQGWATIRWGNDMDYVDIYIWYKVINLSNRIDQSNLCIWQVQRREFIWEWFRRGLTPAAVDRLVCYIEILYLPDTSKVRRECMYHNQCQVMIWFEKLHWCLVRRLSIQLILRWWIESTRGGVESCYKRLGSPVTERERKKLQTVADERRSPCFTARDWIELMWHIRWYTCM